jgi:hypothetical protein
LARGSRCCTADTRGVLPSSPAKPSRQQQQQQQQGLRIGKRQQMLHCKYQGSVTQQSCTALQAAAAAARITCWHQAADAALQIPGERCPAVLQSPAGSSSSSSSSRDYVLARGSRCYTADTRGVLPSSPAQPCRQQQQQSMAAAYGSSKCCEVKAADGTPAATFFRSSKFRRQLIAPAAAYHAVAAR